MKKIFLGLALCLLAFAAPAMARPEAKEIAFTRPCSQGVPVYTKSDDKIVCGAVAKGGSGYVIEMASERSTKPVCPSGFDYIGNLDKDSLAARGINGEGSMQYFACVKR